MNFLLFYTGNQNRKCPISIASADLGVKFILLAAASSKSVLFRRFSVMVDNFINQHSSHASK